MRNICDSCGRPSSLVGTLLPKEAKHKGRSIKNKLVCRFCRFLDHRDNRKPISIDDLIEMCRRERKQKGFNIYRYVQKKHSTPFSKDLIIREEGLEDFKKFCYGP